MVLNKKKKKESNLCYFCMWNTAVTKINRGREILSACKYCATIMEPLVGPKGVWGWNIAALRPTHPGMAELQKQPTRKCPYCSFNNIHQESLANHLRFTHRPNHTYPENLQTEESKLDWLKKMGRRW